MAKNQRIFVTIGAALEGSFKSVFSSADRKAKDLGDALGSLRQKASSIQAFRDLERTVLETGRAWQAAKAKADAYRASLVGVQEPTRRQTQELARLERAAERTFDELGRGRERLAALRGELQRSGVSVGNLAAEEKKLGAAIEANERRMKRMQALTTARANNATARADARGKLFDAAAIGYTLAAPVRQAIEFENAMLGVARQVQGARDANGKLTPVYYEIGRAIQKLGGEIPVATNELAALVTAGARMGIPREELISYAREVSKLSVAFDISADEIGESMGKVANNFKIPMKEIGELGDAINWLDDNAISKGGDIIEYLNRVSGVASTVKITAKETAALGSTLLTLGERTERASTATNAMMQKLASASKLTAKAKAAMAELNIAPAALEKGMQTDAMGTLLTVLDTINKLPEQKRTGVMVELVGLEHSDTLAKLASQTGELRRQIELANSEAAKGSAQREFAARLETTSAHLTRMSNNLTTLGVTIGATVLPMIAGVADVVGKAAIAVQDFAQANPELTKNIMAVAVALGTAYTGSLVLRYGFLVLRGMFLGIAAPIATVLNLFGGLPGVFRGVAVAARFAFPLVLGGLRAIASVLIANPIGLAITAIATAAFLIYEYWQPIKEFMGSIFDKLKEVIPTILPMIVSPFSTLARTFFDIGGQIIDGMRAGIAAKWEELKSYVGNIATSIGDTVKEKLGIKSPSRVFMSIGGDTMAGLHRGIVDGSKTVLQTMGGVASSLARPIAAGALAVQAAAAPMAASAGAGATAGGGATYNITINTTGGNAQEIAREVELAMRRIEQQRKAAMRSSLIDQAGY